MLVKERKANSTFSQEHVNIGRNSEHKKRGVNSFTPLSATKGIFTSL
jgi:hypothetical protein